MFVYFIGFLETLSDKPASQARHTLFRITGTGPFFFLFSVFLVCFIVVDIYEIKTYKV